MNPRLVLFALLPLFWAGCTISRSVVNPQVRDMDTSWIQPGVTTRSDVVARLGMPPLMIDGGGVTEDSFQWVRSDTFSRVLELGYYVVPSFEATRGRDTEDILIRFNDNDVVTLVSRTSTCGGEKTKVLEWRELQ